MLTYCWWYIAEIWREYAGYGLDLNLPSVVPSPDLVTNGNDYMELVDGSLATCVLPNMTTCDMEMKVSSRNSQKENYWVLFLALQIIMAKMTQQERIRLPNPNDSFKINAWKKSICDQKFKDSGIKFFKG